jgi:hypothetical protein
MESSEPKILPWLWGGNAIFKFKLVQEIIDFEIKDSKSFMAVLEIKGILITAKEIKIET